MSALAATELGSPWRLRLALGGFASREHHTRPGQTMTPAQDVEDQLPPDTPGRVIFAMKYLGPTTVIAGVLVWQGIKTTDALREERRNTTTQMIEQTKQVVEGLANSTNAIDRFTDESLLTRRAIESNTLILIENGKKISEILRDKGI